MDETFFIFYDVLDRIFDRDDMLMEVFIEMIDHSHECRRLPTSCSPRDEHESLICLEEFEEILLESYTFCCRDLLLDRTHSDSNSLVIFGDICSKSSSFDLIDKGDTSDFFFQTFCKKCRIHKVYDLYDVIISESSEGFYGLDITVSHTNIGEIPTSDMKIGDMIGDDFSDKLEVFFDERFIWHREKQ